jgi:TolB-like protein/DNA-binding winged helix-turn-helix (wHTH) protein/Tfp pilus assembly protein PilF
MTQSIRFGDWEWDPDILELRNGARVVRLEPRVGRLLDYLLDHPGELLTHDRLIEAVWDGRVVSDEAVRRGVFGLRQALAADGCDEFIRTILKKGYVAEFPEPRAASLPGGASRQPEPPAIAAGPAQVAISRSARSWRLPMLLGLAVAVVLVFLLLARVESPWEPRSVPLDADDSAKDPATIAVLPFVNLSQVADGDILADGLAEELLGTLSLNPELRVTARPSAFQFRGGDRDIRDVGQRLGVRYVLDGSVFNLGERLHIRTRLLDARTDSQLWSGEYDRSMAEWFDLQQVVATEVTRALDGVLQQHDMPVARSMGTPSVEANLEVLRARQLLATRAVADAEQAIEHLQRALLLDRNYALAYARLADAILIQAESTNGVGTARPVVAPLLDKALALDPGLGEAYCLRSLLTDDPATAERDLRRGLELNPSYARGYELLAKLQTGSLLQSQAAIETIDSAIALDPLTPGNHHAKAMLMTWQGKWEEAVELDRRALELNPNYRAALTQLSEIYAIEGRFADAIGYARRAVALDPRAVSSRDHLMLLYLAVGDLEAARAANYPPTPFGNWAISWGEGREGQLIELIYTERPAWVELLDPMLSSQILLRQAVSDGDYARALALLSARLSTGEALQSEVSGWGLYAYANLAQLLKLSGDAATASRLQAQLEERMAALEARIPRLALIHAQVRATLLARAGLSEDACAALEQAYTPNPRPYWRVILANPAFDAMSDAPCLRTLRTRIDKYISAERERIDAMERAEQVSGSAPSNQDHGDGAAT